MANDWTYVAFLRGINVGGNSTIKMDALKAAFAGLGFRNVKTVLASGNVVFEADEADPEILTEKVQAMLKQAYGVDFVVMLRTGEQIRALIAADPFKDVPITPDTRLHVTFLAEKPAWLPDLPYLSADRGYGIIRIFDRELCSFVQVTVQHGTPDLMKMVDQVFGREVTTRTWNTVTRIASLLE